MANEVTDSIVGRYSVAKTYSMINNEFGLFTEEELSIDIKKRVDAGDLDPEDAEDYLQMFRIVYEITEDHRVIGWMKLPEGVSDEEIKSAVEAGEIGEVKDGYFLIEEKPWKEEDGRFFFDSGEHREVFGEIQSSWDELKFGDDGLLEFGKMIRLKRI